MREKMSMKIHDQNWLEAEKEGQWLLILAFEMRAHVELVLVMSILSIKKTIILSFSSRSPRSLFCCCFSLLSLFLSFLHFSFLLARKVIKVILVVYILRFYRVIWIGRLLFARGLRLRYLGRNLLLGSLFLFQSFWFWRRDAAFNLSEQVQRWVFCLSPDFDKYLVVMNFGLDEGKLNWVWFAIFYFRFWQRRKELLFRRRSKRFESLSHHRNRLAEIDAALSCWFDLLFCH